MSRILLGILQIVVCGLALGGGISQLRSGEPLVFISGFAAGEDGAIHAFHFDAAKGTLKPTHRTADVEHPFFIALSPDGRYLYSIHAPGQFGGTEHEQVAAFEVTSDRGELKLLNRVSAKGTAACYLDVDATGRSVLLANYSSGSVAAFPIQADGSLGAAASFFQHEGSSVNLQRQKEPHAHCFVISPDNRFAFAADLGTDEVRIYQLEAATAKLTPHRQPFVRTQPGAGPRHLTFHPNGRHVYVINELLNSVTVFDYDAENGYLLEQQTLSTLPDGYDEVTHCADVKVTANGRFLYGTNRGHDSIAVYQIGEDGRLSRTAIVPSLGKGPQNLAITPDDHYLLCANMPGNNVVVFRIDEQTGNLEAVGEPIEVTSPSCIRIR